MNHPMRSLWLILLFAFAALTVSGCWQPAGDTPDSTPIARALPTATDLPSPTPTPTETPEPIEVTEEVAESGAVVLEVTAVAQAVEPTVDPLILEATNNIIRATQEILAITQTAEAVFQIPTATDTPFGDVVQPTIDPNLFLTLTPGGIGGGAFATQAPGACQHVVQQGQNLFRIALLYRVPLSDLVAQNGIANQNLIRVGQVLNIPGCGNTDPNPPAVDSNGGWAPGANWESNSAGGVQYTVQAGDNLFRISLAYRVPFVKIAAYNGIASPYVISIGQVITIP